MRSARPEELTRRHEALRRFNCRTSLGQLAREAPSLLRRLLGNPAHLVRLLARLRVLLVVLALVVYVLSPFDLLPEAILGVIGLLDDAVVCAIVCMHIAAIYRRMLLQQGRGRARGDGEG